MALISIVLGLILDRMFLHLHELRDMTWFEYYSQKICTLTKNRLPPLQFMLILAPPLLIVLLVQVLLSGVMFNLPGFIFGIAVFIYCLGPACLVTDIDAYVHAREIGDDDEALHYAGAITERAASTSPDQQTTDVTRAILYVANERIFSAIFWFVMLGPFGALLYRLTAQLSKQIEYEELSAFANYIQAIMAFIPARMLAMGYALTGNFDAAYHAYKGRLRSPDISHSNFDVLVSAGIGAMKDMEMKSEIASIHAAQALVMRSVMVWIAVLAILTLGGWLQ
ncbi:MAG TPA: regulatory signaling modulator protein AmpE [Thiotrichales bacterium]|nr:regulatory signaling modulator protein AmpE [Thiotrichales bacterium]